MLKRCPGCGLHDEDGHSCSIALRAALRHLIADTGRVGLCKACSATIYWISKPGGRGGRAYDGEGTPHAQSCRESSQLRRRATSGLSGLFQQ